MRIEDEVLGDRGPIEALASGRHHVAARPCAEPLPFPVAGEGLDRLVDVVEPFGDRDPM